MEKQIQKKFETEKGKPCILVEDYKYSEFKVLKKCGNIRYNCTNKNCSASLLVDKDVTKVLSMLNEHTHEVIPKNIISRQIVSSRLKRKCENDLLTRPNKIIRQELRNTENDIQPVYSDIKLWRKCMYDKRRKNMQKIPKSLEEAITQLFDGRENIITNTGELFCHMEETSSPIIFTCKTNLELLSQSSHIFADGTFSYAPKYFEQLYSIHILQNGFYVPVIYCFFISKSTETYIQIWHTIINLCLRFDIDIQNSLKCSNFHFDFEKSAHNAVRHFFPNCKIMACRFNLGQSWFRKIQSDSNLLKNYNSKSELGVWLKQFFALGFLPSEDVEDAFTFLIENSPTDNFEFTDYILNNYISSDAAFPPILWATEPSTEARTTNGPESFHSHYNAQFYTSHPSIHQVIHILLDIQSETYLKIYSIKQQNINKPRKEQEENIAFIINTWEKYKNNEISLNDYLLILGPRFCAKKL